MLDVVTAANEIIHEANEKNKWAIFKVDFQKAYGLVSWDPVHDEKNGVM